MSSFPLVSFLITLLLAAAVCTHGQEWVRDTNGNRVRINDQYFIQPAGNTGNNGGGLVPLAAKISLCLLGITQALPGEPGVQVSFSFPPTLIPPLPFSPVRTNFGITIEFKSNVCKDISKFWEVDGSSLISEEPAIQIGGNPRERNSRFKIEKVGEEGRTNIYRFTTSDGTVGAIPGPLDSSQLVLTNDVAKTIFFKFIKVNAVTTDNDGLHFRQPSVMGVQQEVERLKVRVHEHEKLLRECEALKAQVRMLVKCVSELERVLTQSPQESSVKERRKWSVKEDLILIGAWLNTSKDSIVSTEQKGGAFWKRIVEYYNSSPLLIGKVPRELGQCKQRWARINDLVCKFAGCYEMALREQRSGQNDHDMMKAALDIFYSDQNMKFNLEHAWRELRHDVKWCSTYLEKDNDKRKTADNPVAEPEERERPIGVKAAKAAEKRKKTGKEEELAKLEGLLEMKKQISKQSEVQDHVPDEDKRWCLFLVQSQAVFMRIVDRLSENVSFFQQRRDAVGRLGLSPLQKCTAALRMLAYGCAADAVDEYLRLGKSTTLSCLSNFTEGVIQLFGDEYLGRPTPEDLQRLLDIGEIRGFPGMIGSIDCMHWEWKNFPTAWKGQYTRGSGKPTIVLEDVASQDLWI
uniref:Myb-like domain-containing protein n=1 Tax=Brassica oleracea var. oleracea TaxID=109376 RepID=A0A0D2ZQT3_BRAOL